MIELNMTFVQAMLLLPRNQVHMAGFAQQFPFQRIAAMLVWFRGELDATDLTSVAVLMVGVPQTLNSVAISTIFLRNDKMVTSSTLWSIFPVVVLQAVNFTNLPLSKSLCSNLLLACRAGKTGGMVCSLYCTDYVVGDDLPARPAQLQTGLIAVLA